jgi:hypothetical protein
VSDLNAKLRDWDYYCSHCQDFVGRLTDWERDFVESIRERLDSGQELSERQAEKLEQIYCKLP